MPEDNRLGWGIVFTKPEFYFQGDVRDREGFGCGAHRFFFVKWQIIRLGVNWGAFGYADTSLLVKTFLILRSWYLVNRIP